MIIDLMTGKQITTDGHQIGRRVRYVGDMANNGGDGAIAELSAHGSSVALDDGRLLRGIMTIDDEYRPGGRFHFLPGIAGSAEIAALIAKHDKKVAAEKVEEINAAAAFEAECSRLRSAFPDLVDASKDHNAAAKNCRKLLKKEFPGVKFSVRTDRYSGGSSLRIGWSDGPKVAEVEKITGRFSGGRFDGMEDIYNYNRTPWTECFGDEKYIFAGRNYSDALLQATIDDLVTEYAGNIENTGYSPTVEDFHSGRTQGLSPMGDDSPGHYSWSQIIRRKLEDKDQ